MTGNNIFYKLKVGLLFSLAHDEVWQKTRQNQAPSLIQNETYGALLLNLKRTGPVGTAVSSFLAGLNK